MVLSAVEPINNVNEGKVILHKKDCFVLHILIEYVQL